VVATRNTAWWVVILVIALLAAAAGGVAGLTNVGGVHLRLEHALIGVAACAVVTAVAFASGMRPRLTWRNRRGDDT
jgi:hypothetical protein